MHELFRKEARQPGGARWHGTIVMVRPISLTVFAVGSLVLLGCTALLLFFGTYTPRVTAQGSLVPDLGMVRVYSPRMATVARVMVASEGSVLAGAPLIGVSTERYTSSNRDTNLFVAEQAQSRVSSLREEVSISGDLAAQERRSLERQISDIEEEAGKIEEQLDVQRRRAEAGAKILNRYSELSEKGFVSAEHVQEREAESLALVSAVRSLERERLAMQRDAAEVRERLQQLDARHQSRQLELRRMLSAAEQDAAEIEAQRDLVITSPVSGIVAAVLVKTGQAIDPDVPVAAIIPENAKLEAHIYVGSKAVGFVRIGDRLRLRYEAYPYQRYGQAHGIVIDVASAALPMRDMARERGTIATNGDQEALYRVIVSLESQHLVSAGRTLPLRAGMAVEADVFQEPRRLYSWIFDPLAKASRAISQ